MREPVQWRSLGLCAYDDALAQQEAAWDACRHGGPDMCFAVEHPPTITLGRRDTRDDLRRSTSELARLGVALHATERGGGATYHGPGQLVVYPIVRLAAHGLTVQAFVWRLDAIMLAIAAATGVAAERDPERGHGIWTAAGKLGALGIRVRDGVTTHGLALNVDLDLGGFALIAPCSVPGLPVTSLRREGSTATVADLLPIAERACRRFLAAPTAREAEARL